MIDRGHRLPLSRQADLLGISPGSLTTILVRCRSLMRRIDELQLDYPFAGSRMLRDLLRGEDIAIGRQQGTTMMQRIGIRGDLPTTAYFETRRWTKGLSLICCAACQSNGRIRCGRWIITYIPMVVALST